MNKSVQNGVIAGVIGIILFMAAYFLQPKLIFNVIPWINFLVVLFFMYKTASDAKKANGGFIDLKGALKEAWIPAIIAIAILVIFRYVLFNVIDPDLVNLQIEISMKQSEKLMGMLGQEVDFETMDDIEEEIRKRVKFTFGKAFLGMLASWVLHFIPAIIMAAVLKKKRAEF